MTTEYKNRFERLAIKKEKNREYVQKSREKQRNIAIKSHLNLLKQEILEILRESKVSPEEKLNKVYNLVIK